MSEEYHKNFDGWNNIKKRIESGSYIPYFDVGEIWWCVLGVNIGIEADGKGEEFLRPIIILNKYNEFGCLIIPISSARVENQDNVSVGIIQDKQGVANLSQIRSISSKRLIEKIRLIDKDRFFYILETAMKYNFSSRFPDIPSPVKESSPKADID